MKTIVAKLRVFTRPLLPRSDSPPGNNRLILSYNESAMTNQDFKPGVNVLFSSHLLKLIMALMLSSALLTGCGYFKKKDEFEGATAEEIYENAKEQMVKKNWQTAIERLRLLEARFPYGVYAEQAQIDTIFCYYRNQQPGLAIAAAERFIKLNPTHPSVDYAYYLKGLASFNEDKSLYGRFIGEDDLSDRDPSQIRTAMLAFEDVYTLFPESQYAPDSRRRAKYLYEALARNETYVAYYYFTRQAFVAVVNRAKGIIENYPTTPSVEQALALLMFSYQNMGLQDLANDSRRVLELNYPDSEYLELELSEVRFANKYTPSANHDDDGWFSSMFDWFKKDEPEPEG